MAFQLIQPRILLLFLKFSGKNTSGSLSALKCCVPQESSFTSLPRPPEHYSDCRRVVSHNETRMTFDRLRILGCFVLLPAQLTGEYPVRYWSRIIPVYGTDLVHYTVCLVCTEEPVDVLAALGVTVEQTGDRVILVEGRCGGPAYRLAEEQGPMGVNTRQLFPTAFPRDFSLITSLRLAPNTSSATLLALYR
ncbi:hypothetical protein J6590_060406 [Homalodisca vitripennis]|nr:hypothetical protein J6590_060406 [Homalodisca vitripennis]